MPKLKPETKKQREAERLAEFLSISVEEVLRLQEPLRETPEEKSREAEAILGFTEDPSKYVQKICKHCKEAFATNYKFVAFCSNFCRSNNLKRLGLDWRPERTAEERWRRAQIPIDYTIPAPALKVLLEVAVSQGLVRQEQLDPERLQDSEPTLQETQQEVTEEVSEVLSHQEDTTQTPYDDELAALGIF